MKKLLSLFLGLFLFASTMFSTTAKVLDIREKDDPMLREISTEVTSFDEDLAVLIDDMAETMKTHNCVSISAPEVGQNLRIFLVEYDGEITVYINPTIEIETGEQDSWEGCLSVEGTWGIVKRPKYIRGRAYDKNGEEFEFEAEGDEARFICHEYDHLEGKLFIDSAIKTFTNKRFIINLFIASAVAIVLGVSLGLLVRHLLF